MIRLFNERGFVAPSNPLIEGLGLELTEMESFLRRSRWAARPSAD